MFGKRLLTTVIGLPLAGLAIYIGGPLFLVLIMLAGLIGMYEYYKCTETVKSKMTYAAMAVEVLMFGLMYFIGAYAVPLSISVMILALFAMYIIKYPEYSFEELRNTVFGFLYPAVLASYIYLVRAEDNGLFLVWLIFIASWGNDTCAYCVGMLFGKHKMTPLLSPKKSWEGFFGGIIGACLIALIFSLAFKLNAVVGVVAVLIASLFSVAGDLAASGIKRTYGVKDYGNIFPGHGGMMDRIDSCLFAAPVIYYCIVILSNIL